MNIKRRGLKMAAAVLFLMGLSACASVGPLRGTGDLGMIIERSSGKVAVIDTTTHKKLWTVGGLGDLSHASVVYSRDGRYGYVFGRDGGLSKVDLLTGRLAGRVMQAGNSIGGAISQDGAMVAVSNYTPGGVRIFDAKTLAPIADIPAVYDGGKRSKTVGLVDAPGNKFVFTLYDAGQIWVVDMSDRKHPAIRKFKNIGKMPYDGMITPDGRTYIAGLFGEDGLAKLDLWNLDKGVQRILNGYGRGQKVLPVYKMPHLEGWAAAGELLFLPAVGHHEVLVVDRRTWREVAHIPTHGQPVFVVSRPDGRQVWVNFAHPLNDVVQVIDVKSLKVIKSLELGPGVLHLEFTPRGEQVWISVRDRNVVDVFDTRTFKKIAVLPVDKPSGIFMTDRAGKIGL